MGRWANCRYILSRHFFFSKLIHINIFFFFDSARFFILIFFFFFLINTIRHLIRQQYILLLAFHSCCSFVVVVLFFFCQTVLSWCLNQKACISFLIKRCTRHVYVYFILENSRTKITTLEKYMGMFNKKKTSKRIFDCRFSTRFMLYIEILWHIKFF